MQRRWGGVGAMDVPKTGRAAFASWGGSGRLKSFSQTLTELGWISPGIAFCLRMPRARSDLNEEHRSRSRRRVRGFTDGLQPAEYQARTALAIGLQFDCASQS